MQNHTIINKFSDRTTAWCQITISIQNTNIYCVCARRLYLYIEKEQATKITFCKSIYIFIVWSLSFVSVRIANILFMSLLFCQSFFTLLRNLFATHTLPKSQCLPLCLLCARMSAVSVLIFILSQISSEMVLLSSLLNIQVSTFKSQILFLFHHRFSFCRSTWYFRTRKRERTRERDFIQTQQYTTILFWIFFFFFSSPSNKTLSTKYHHQQQILKRRKRDSTRNIRDTKNAPTMFLK